MPKVQILHKGHQTVEVVDGEVIRTNHKQGAVIEISEGELKANLDRFALVKDDVEGKGELLIPAEPEPIGSKGLGTALFGLDPENDEHWEKQVNDEEQLPNLEVLRRACGNPDVPRTSVNDIIPGYNRSVARLRAAGKELGDETDLDEEVKGKTPDGGGGGDFAIVEAVHSLDPEDDEHWTADGKPKMAVIETFVGDSDISREDVEDATDGLTRAGLKTLNDEKE